MKIARVGRIESVGMGIFYKKIEQNHITATLLLQKPKFFLCFIIICSFKENVNSFFEKIKIRCYNIIALIVINVFVHSVHGFE